MKLKSTLISIIAFILLETTSVLIINDIFKREGATHYLEEQTKELNIKYQTINNTYKAWADFVFYQNINQEQILKLYSKAYKSDSIQQAAIRDSLYKILRPTYKQLKRNNIRQFHFHLPDCTSFLRFHRPEKFGDDIGPVRYSVRTANLEKRFVQGFEEGRLYNGFRFVYPLSYQRKHIGSVEISISFGAIKEQLKKLNDGVFGLMIKKEVVEQKLFSYEKKNYNKSSFCPNYLIENEFHHYNDTTNFIPSEVIKKLDIKTKKEISSLIKKEKAFSISQKYNDENHFLSFLPIYNIEGKQVAYIFSYEINNIIFYDYKQRSITLTITTATILILIFFYNILIHKISQIRDSKEKYKGLFQFMEEGFLRADANGKIILANHAIAKMCGYTTHKELIGVSITELYANPEIRNRLIQKVKENNIIKNIDIILKRKDGSKFHSLSTIKLLNFENDKFSGTEGIIRDITKHKRAEQKIIDQNKKHAALNQEYAAKNEEYASLNEDYKIKNKELADTNKKLIRHEAELKERLKELNGIHSLRLLTDKYSKTEEMFFELTNNIVPASMQYPDKVYALLLINGKKYCNKENYYLPENIDFLSSDIVVSGKQIGKLIVTYTDVLPFIEIFEQRLIDTYTEIISKIIELNEAEKKLKEAEEQQRKILNTFEHGIYICSPDFKIKYANSAFLKNYGEVSIGKLCHKTIYNSEQICSWCIYDDLKKKKKIELERKNPDGKIFNTTNILLDNNEKLTIFRDITQRKKDEQRIHMLSTAIEQSPSSVVITDTDGNIEYVNPQFTVTTGYSYKEVLGKNMRILKSDATHIDTYIDLWKKIKLGKIWEGELINKTKKGNEFYERNIITPIKNEKNEIVNFLAVKEDVTNNKIMEIQLAAYREDLEGLVKRKTKDLKISRDNFKNLFEESHDFIIITNKKGSIIEANKAFCNMLGYTKKELLEMNIYDHTVSGDQMRQSNILNYLKRVNQVNFETENITKHGEIIPIEASSTLFNYFGEEAILTSGRDLTYRKEMQRKILNAIIETEEKEKSRFAKELHDGLGPLLTTTKLYSKALSSESPGDDKNYILSKINETIDEAIHTTKDISNNLSPHVLRNFGLTLAIKSFFLRLADFEKIHFDFHTTLNDRINENIEVTLYRITVELIHNTIKHANAKNIKIELFFMEKDMINYSYSDDGIGFDYNSTVKQNMGMGLTNIFNRVKSLGGKVEFHSKVKRGMKVQIQILTTQQSLHEK